MRAKHKKAIARAVTGKKNSQWKGGKNQGTVRSKAGGKKGDGKIAHHTKSGVKLVSRSKHEAIHKRRAKKKPSFPKGRYS